MDIRLADGGPGSAHTPIIEIRVFHETDLLARELCGDEWEAAAVIEQWYEQDVTFLVDELGERPVDGARLAVSRG